MESKKIIVIYANCMGNCIRGLLQARHANEFLIYYFTNFEIINSKMSIPQELKDADIFLYQNYSERSDEYDMEKIIKTYLKPTCQKICFPTLHSCNLLFGYNTFIGNVAAPEPGFPHGPFHFGIKDVFENLNHEKSNYNDTNELIAKVIANTEAENFIPKDQIEYYKNRTFQFLENKILNSDFPELLDYIKSNYTKIRLWSNPNHPTNYLTNELCKNIFFKLNLPYDETANLLFFTNTMNDWVMPIFSCVQTHLKLQFDCNHCSSWFHKDINNKQTYLQVYLKCLINK